jgi:RDD family
VAEDPRAEALRRLEDDYMRGAIDAEEYTQLKKRVMEGYAPSPAQPGPAPYWPPPPAGAPVPPRQHAAYAGVPGIDPFTGQPLASWGRRAAALLLDSLIYILSLVATFAWAYTTEDPDTGDISDAAAWVLIVQLFLVPTLYYWLAVGKWGKTLGKHALGIAVRRAEDAGRIGYGRALGRAVSVVFLSFCTLPLVLSYLWPLWDQRNQTLHDKMVSSIVVRDG